MNTLKESVVECLDAVAEFWGVVSIDENKSAIVFLCGFEPFVYDSKNFYADAYYFCSNNGYSEAKNLSQKLNVLQPELNATTRGVGKLPLKKLAVMCGLCNYGFDNTLCYNSKYGSYFYIQAVIIDGIYNRVMKHSHPVCTHCGACIMTCPTKALSGGSEIKRNECLRDIMDGGEIISDKISADMGTSVLGCFRCQQCCPLNQKPTVKIPEEFDEAIKRALTDGNISYFTEKFGGNIVPKHRILNLIINACGQAGRVEYILEIEKLSKQPEYRVNSERTLRLLKNKSVKEK